MGLLDKIKQKKDMEAKTAPPAAGKQLSVSSEEEFIETCKDLTGDFKGILFLSGEVDGENYSASLIVEQGAIVGSTFELGGLILFREQAIDDIKEKLRGSKGTLNIYEFEPEDMQRIKESNKSAFTAGPLPISSLGLKLTLRIEQEPAQEEGGGFPSFGGGPPERKMRPRKVPSLVKAGGNFNLLELARKPESIKDLPKAPKMNLEKKDDDELPDFALDKVPDEGGGIGLPSLGGLGGDRKLEEMRRIKEERQKKVADWLATKNKKREEEQREEAASGKPIQTPIDRLYSLVKKYQKLRIDDKLAHALGVSRTQIEEWAVILEEHDLIELHYPTIGEPEIRVKEVK
jgi:hypothetical protein